jgi:GxxExxY protein
MDTDPKEILRKAKEQIRLDKEQLRLEKEKQKIEKDKLKAETDALKLQKIAETTYTGITLDFIQDEDIIFMTKIKQMCIEVAKELGKGRAECVYQNAMCQELQMAGIRYISEETLRITYKGVFVGHERADIHIVEPYNMVLEMKATSSEIRPDEYWQVISYMKTVGSKFGAVINFNQSPSKMLQVEFIVINNNNSTSYIYDIENKITKGEPMNDYN